MLGLFITDHLKLKSNEKIFVKKRHICDKGLLSKIWNELLKLNSQNINNFSKNSQQILHQLNTDGK